MEKLSETNSKIDCDMNETNTNPTDFLHFSKNPKFSVESMKTLSEKLNTIKTDDEKESFYSEFLFYLQNLDKSSFFSSDGEITNQEEYFINNLGPKVINTILNTNNDNSNAYLRESQFLVLNFFLKIFINNMQKIRLIPLWSVLIGVFNDSKHIHKARNKNFDVGERFLELNYEILNPHSEEWRNNLKKGDFVDILIIEKENFGFANERRNNGSWSIGEIFELDSSNNARIRLIGKGDIISTSLNSCFILPKGTLSQDFEWRESLVYPNKVDILDCKSWHQGTIMEVFERTRAGQIYKWVKVGARAYKKDGKNKDSKDRTFYGFSETFDKELSVHDPKIRKPWTFSKVIENWDLLNKYPSDSKKYNEVETYFPHEINGTKFYAVGYRTDKEIDLGYIEIINKFGKEGGFEKILASLGGDDHYGFDFNLKQNKSSPTDVKQNLSKIMENYNSNFISKQLSTQFDFDYLDSLINIHTEILFSIHTFLHTEFAKIYLKNFLELIQTIFKEFSTNDELRYKIFPKREKFETLFKKLKHLMDRVYIETDSNFKWETFTLDLSLSLLNSSMLEKKLLGIKFLTKVLNEIKGLGLMMPSNSQYEQHMPSEKVAEILRRENLLNILFGTNTHLQIVQKSGDILKALVNAKIFGDEELVKLYSLYQEMTDLNLNMALFKVIKDSLYAFGTAYQKTFLRYMLNNIKYEKQVGVYLKQELELILSLHQKLPLYESGQFNKEIGEYFFHLLFLDSEESFESILTETMSLIKSYDFKDHRVPFLESILQKTKINPNSKDFIKSLKIIRRIMTTVGASIEEFQRNKIYSLMIDDYEIIKNCIEFLQIELVMKTNIPQEGINEFFSFMHFLLHNCSRKFKIEEEMVNSLYTLFIENSQDMTTQNCFFKFLKEADDRKFLPEATFAKIFSKMVGNTNLKLNNLSVELIKVLWSIFLNVNRSNNKIEIQENIRDKKANSDSNFVSNHNSRNDPSNKSSNYSNYGNYGNLLSFDPEEIKITIFGSPLELDGFTLIYKAITSVHKADIFICLTNFIQLFKLDEKSQSERKEIWEKTCQIAIQDISLTKEDKNFDRVENILIFLKLLIEVSEHKGNAAVLPHYSVVEYEQTRLLNLKIKVDDIDIEESILITIYSNRSYLELKHILTKKIAAKSNTQNFFKTLSPDSINLQINEKEYTDENNSKTLEQLGFNDSCDIKITKNKAIDDIGRVALTNSKGELLARVKEILSMVFKNFSSTKKKCHTPGEETLEDSQFYMNNEDCARFIKEATALDDIYDISPEDPRVLLFLKKYDDDKDGLLSIDNFLKFYYDQCKSNKLDVVWENLKNFGYRNNLTHLSEPLLDYNNDPEILPRYILSQGNYFEVIFSLLGSFDYARDFIRLICTNAQVVSETIDLKFLTKLQSEEVSEYYKSYVLEVVDYYFYLVYKNPLSDCTEIDEKYVNTGISLNEFRESWIKKFFFQGGLKICLDLLNRVNENMKLASLLPVVRIISNALSILQERKITSDVLTDLNTIFSDKSKSIISNVLSIMHFIVNLNVNYKDNFNINVYLNINVNVNVSTELKVSRSANLDNQVNQVDLVNLVNLVNLDLMVAALFKLISLIFVTTQNFDQICLFFINETPFKEIILNGLLTQESKPIREKFCENLISLIKTLVLFNTHESSQKCISLIINIIHEKLFNIYNEQEISHCEEFFNFEESIISLCYSDTKVRDKLILVIDFPVLSLKILDFVKENTDKLDESVLSGLLKIESCLITKEKKIKSMLSERGFIKFLTDNVLFKEKREILNSKNSDNYVDVTKFKYTTKEGSSKLLENIFELLNLLCENSIENLSYLFRTKFSEIPSNKKFTSLNLQGRASCGMVGLKNLGCICYMNSILQQFFCIPSFRYSLLQTQDNKNLTVSEDAKDIDDNLLHQMQRMFTFLLISDRISYNPKDFCLAYKDFTGRRTNVTQQQDAQEFLGRLFDLLDNATKPTSSKYLIQNFFGGQTLSTMACTICGNSRNNIEDFCNLSLEVKNMKTLKDSLDKFTSEEKIEGYQCSNCNKTTTLSKRNSLATLPNILIIHLQRIGYNYDTGANEKVNSKLEFPKSLNLKNYSSINVDTSIQDRVYEREEAYYDYHLVGVVVHIGHADAGHYISYINISRDGKDENSWMKNDDWLNFNDAHVSHFEMSSLEENTYGGDSSFNINGSSLAAPACPAGLGYDGANLDYYDISTRQPMAAGEFQGGNYYQPETGQSAYMLVYERVKKSPIKIVLQNVDNNSNVVLLNKENKFPILKSFDIFNANKEENENFSYNLHDPPVLFDQEANEYFKLISFYSVSKKIPQLYYNEVLNDNIEFFNDKKIFNKSFNDFLQKIIINLEFLLKKVKNPNRQNKISIAIDNGIDNGIDGVEDTFIEKELSFIFSVIFSYIFEVIPKAETSDYFKSTLDKLTQIMNEFNFISASLINYLINARDLLSDVIFSTEEKSSIYKSVICNAIRMNLQYSSKEEVCVQEDGMILDLVENKNKDSTSSDLPSFNLIKILLDFLPVTASKNWTKMLSYLEILDEISKSEDTNLIQFLSQQSLIGKLVDFFLGKESPTFSKHESRHEIKGIANAKFAPLFSTIANLLGNAAYKLSEEEMILLSEKKFYLNAMKENFNNRALSKIISTMMKSNYKFTVEAMFWVLEVVNRNTSLQEAKNSMDIISEIVIIDDEYTRIRMEWLFGIPQIVINLNTGCIPSLPINVSRHGDKLYKFVSHILLYCSGTHDCLTERLFYKFYSSSDFLQIINLFIENILLRSPQALQYFECLPHPKPGNNHTANARARDFLFELAREEIQRYNSLMNKKPYENALKNYFLLVEKYEALCGTLLPIDFRQKVNKFITNNSMENQDNIPVVLSVLNEKEEKGEEINGLASIPLMDTKLFDHQYKKGPIYSDIISLCDHMTQSAYEEMTAKNIFLICIEMEAGIKSPLVEPTSSNSYLSHANNTYYEGPKDDCQLISMSQYQNKSEDEFYKNLCNGKLPLGLKYRRILKSYIPQGTKVENSFRRYILYNSSHQNYKLKLKFKAMDPQAMNCYLPHTDIVIIIKKVNGQNVTTICKPDPDQPYGDYQIDVEIIPLDNDSIMLNAGSASHLINVFQEEEKKAEIQVQADPEPISNSEEFEVECYHCRKKNFVNYSNNNFRCNYCHRDLFG